MTTAHKTPSRKPRLDGCLLEDDGNRYASPSGRSAHGTRRQWSITLGTNWRIWISWTQSLVHDVVHHFAAPFFSWDKCETGLEVKEVDGEQKFTKRNTRLCCMTVLLDTTWPSGLCCERRKHILHESTRNVFSTGRTRKSPAENCPPNVWPCSINRHNSKHTHWRHAFPSKLYWQKTTSSWPWVDTLQQDLSPSITRKITKRKFLDAEKDRATHMPTHEAWLDGVGDQDASRDGPCFHEMHSYHSMPRDATTNLARTGPSMSGKRE